MNLPLRTVLEDLLCIRFLFAKSDGGISAVLSRDGESTDAAEQVEVSEGFHYRNDGQVQLMIPPVSFILLAMLGPSAAISCSGSRFAMISVSLLSSYR